LAELAREGGGQVSVRNSPLRFRVVGLGKGEAELGFRLHYTPPVPVPEEATEPRPPTNQGQGHQDAAVRDEKW
jgi:hypothetical protein